MSLQFFRFCLLWADWPGALLACSVSHAGQTDRPGTFMLTGQGCFQGGLGKQKRGWWGDGDGGLSVRSHGSACAACEACNAWVVFLTQGIR